MGVGQVVTLRPPTELLRDVNRAIERTAWGGYRTILTPKRWRSELPKRAPLPRVWTIQHGGDDRLNAE